MKKCSIFCIAFLLLLVSILGLACAALAFFNWRKEPPKNEKKIPTVAFPLPAHQEKYHQEMVKKINGAGTSWTAVYNKFASEWVPKKPHGLWKKKADLRSEKYVMFGMKVWDEIGRPTNRHFKEMMSSTMPIPEEFDARLQWPECWSLHRVPNQGACGSCWAIAASTVISDRICIHSNGSQQPEISTEDIISCTKPSGGCVGGLDIVAFWTWVNKGFVTGGPYGSNEGCRPYTIPNDCGIPCHWYYWGYNTGTPKCTRKCQPLYQKSYDQDKYYGRDVYALNFRKNFPFSPQSYTETIKKFIQKEIGANGPVQVCFSVYEDFQHYHSGVYTRVTGRYLYGHCVRLIGWGETEDKVPYWIAVNSFGRNWGRNGIFWLHRNYKFSSLTAGVP